MRRYMGWSAISRIFMHPCVIVTCTSPPAALAPAHRVDLPLCWTVLRFHANALNEPTQGRRTHWTL